jgi:two-component system OmpR family sensor kinase
MKLEVRSLAWRIYAFATLIGIVSIGAMVATVIIVRKPPVENKIGVVNALAVQLTERYPNNSALIDALEHEPSLKPLDLFIYDRHGTLLAGVGRPLEPPTPAELLVTIGAPRVDLDRMVFAMGADRVLLYRPAGPSRGDVIATLLVVVGVVLAIALAGTFFFARTLVRPLRRLGDAARAFGRGETNVRTELTRRDELGAVGHAFDEMAGRIEQLLQTQRAMMADISHELRTPLTRIKLALDLASADPHAAQQVLDDVGADLEEIEQIIEDVFVVVRLDSAQSKIRRKDVDIVEMVHQSAARFEARHPSHPLTVEIGTVTSALCQGDAMLLRRALDNLLDNAAKYSTDGAPVVLRLAERAETFAIEVVDSGIGMNTSELGLAFTPFWRADVSRTRETGGVGLGLALARRVARAHGGDVELESSRSSGTVARLTISRLPPESPSPAIVTVRNKR